MSNDGNKARAIFLEAIEHPPEQRAAFLDDACSGNAQLRDRVERLLRSHEQLGTFHDVNANAGVTIDQPITEKPGTQIGPYKLLQEIGHGGMGMVYMADQKEPVKRRVALKIIKPGMDTRQVIARFEAERQALAMMDHPNIARVLDAGTTDSGRPYFVMELVNGIPVTRYCDEQHLTPRERLELFIPICHAVQHAHQKGIIHRDIKPSNVLLALYDGRPVPKVIDFGVAKATTQTLTERTVFTQLGQIVGTLEYMSPEQAQRNQLDVDTRSDIYSLGVLLYELLTGETPFDRQRLRSAAWDEMVRIIREEEPPRPSLRLSSSHSLPSIAANRHIEPKKLSTLVRGELDWIVMKALEKDRARRYETANGFANDIQRYLNDEPVAASPPSAAYRFRKFARRNKVALATASVVLLSLMAVLITFSLYQLELADRSLRVERSINSALTKATRLRGQAASGPVGNPSAWAQARDHVQRAVALAESGPADPVLAAQVRKLSEELDQEQRDRDLLCVFDEAWLAQANTDPQGLGRWAREQCVPILTKALEARGLAVGQTPPEDAVAVIRNMPAAVRAQLLVALEEWAHSRTTIPGVTLRYVGDEATPDSNSPGTNIRLLPSDRIVGTQLGWGGQMVEKRPNMTFMPLGSCLSPIPGAIVRFRVIRYGQATAQTYEVVPDPILAWLQTVVKAADTDPWRQRMREAFELTDEVELRTTFEKLADEADLERQPVRVLTRLSDTLQKLQSGDRAIALARQIQRRFPGDVHANLSLADLLKKANPPQFEEVARYYTAAVALCPASALTHSNFGVVLSALGKPEQAIEQYREALRVQQDFFQAANNICSLLTKQGKHGEAITEMRRFVSVNPTHDRARYSLGTRLMEQGIFEEAVAELREVVRLEPNQSPYRINLAYALRRKGKFEEAILQYREGLRRFPAFGFRSMIARTLAEQGKVEEAMAELRKAIEVDPKDADAHLTLGDVLRDQGKLEDAIACYRKAVEVAPKYTGAHLTLGGVLTDHGKLDEAAACYRNAIEVCPKDGVWHNNLGGVLTLQGKLDEAVACYREALELVPRAAAGHFNLGVTLKDQGKLDEAAACLRKAIELDPNDPAAHCKLGAVLEAQGKLDEALAFWRKAINMDPKDAAQHASVAWLLATCPEPKLRNPKRAVELAKKAVDLEPGLVRPCNTLGVAFYRAGQWKETIAALEKSQTLKGGTNKNTTINAFFLAMGHWQLGQKEQARHWYDKAATWMKDNKPDAELKRFRAEADELLGIVPDKPEAIEPPPPAADKGGTPGNP